MIAASQRQHDALALRKGGYSLQAIADQLGYRSPSGAWNAIRRALKEVLREPAEAVRQLELARLDTLLSACWQQALNGNLAAIDRALRIMERRAAYLGLDAPVKIDIASYIREFAEREGLDPNMAIAEAQRVIKEHSAGWT